VGPRAGLDVVVKTKIPSPYWDLNPRLSSARSYLVRAYFVISDGFQSRAPHVGYI